MASGVSPKLLKYTGVQQAIVQNDFSPYVFEPHEIDSTKNGILTDSNFVPGIQAGDWEFYTYTNPDIKPLFYIPQNLVNAVVESAGLSNASQIPQLNDFGDAFLFQQNKAVNLRDLSNFANIKNNIYQVECMDCLNPDEEKLNIPPPPLILPTNPLYAFFNMANKFRLSRISNPEEKVDFLLGNISKEISATDKVILNPKNSVTVNNMISKWGLEIEQISALLEKINTVDRRATYNDQVSSHYWNFLARMQEWENLNTTNETRNKLADLENKLSILVQESDITINTNQEGESVGTLNYRVNLPSAGIYNLALYNFRTQFDQSLKSLIKGNELILKKNENSENWYTSDALALPAGPLVISLPELKDIEHTYPGFEVRSERGNTSCNTVNFGKVDPGAIYEIRFEYFTVHNELNKFSVNETGLDSLGSKAIKIDLRSERSESTRLKYNAKYDYVPNRSANTASLEVCATGNDQHDGDISIYNLKVVESHPGYQIFLVQNNPTVAEYKYKLEFVALNQTAYLVRISGVDRNFLLNFNERVDSGWKITKISPDSAAGYFKGAKKEYLNGKVIEYERQDRHLFSDRFLKISDPISADFSLNTFSNAWMLDNDEDGAMYLVEYALQRKTYKVAVISMVALLSLITSLVVYIVKKNLDEKKNS